MGYSISVKFKNPGQKEKVLDFIEENQALINQTVSLSFLGSVKLPQFNIESFFENENIPYGPRGKNLIGWNERGISQGLYAFVLWLSNKCENDFYYYDNKKLRFVVTEEFNENANTAQVNNNGILFKEEILPEKGLLQKMVDYLSEEENKYNQLIVNLDMLNEKWNKQLLSEIKPKAKKKM